MQLQQRVDLKLTSEYEVAQFAQRRPKRSPQKVVQKIRQTDKLGNQPNLANTKVGHRHRMAV